MKLFRRVYRIALALLPAPFREQHGAEAMRMAAARVREERGMRRLLRGCREITDLFVSARSLRGGPMRGNTWSDLGWAIKSLARSRAFLAISLGTLSVALALCTAVMVVVNAYLIRGLPFPHADRLYSVAFTEPNGPLFRDLERVNWQLLEDVVEEQIAWDLDAFNLRGAPYPEVAQGAWVTPGYMAGYGVRTVAGRPFQATDYEPQAPLVAIISHRMWQTRFAGAADVVGRRFEAYVHDRAHEPQLFTIVGILPADHWHLNAFTEVLAPLRAPSYPYMVRVRHGVTAAVAKERITAAVGASGLALPAGWRVELTSTHAAYVEQMRPLLLTLAVATALVLLIACANVAVLFTVRMTERASEIAVRKALGASAGRVARTLASEAIVLGVSATALGLLMTWLVISATAPVMSQYLGRVAPGGAGALRLDGTALAGGVLTGLVVTIICCVAQLWVSSRVPLTSASGSGQKGASAGPGQRRAHAALIASEVAVCLTLLVGAALLIESGVRILRVDMGLDTRDVLVSRMSLNQQRYPDALARATFYERAQAALESIDGVHGVGFTSTWPLQAPPTRPVSAVTDAASAATSAGLVTVSHGYFAAVSIPLVAGRGFTPQDGAATERMAIVSRTLAARLWPAARAVGQRLYVRPPQGAPPTAQGFSALVIGVVGDLRHSHTDDDLADAYLPLLQNPMPGAFLYVRGTIDTPQIARGLQSIDPDLALEQPRPLSGILDRQRIGSRFLASLLVIFALFAAVLALVGIYGVVAYTVRQRRREIAVRLAIGAGQGAIVRLFLRQGVWILAAGLACGVVGALILGRVLQTQLYGVNATDPLTLVSATAAFGLCGLAAMFRPARAAAATDPGIVLKG